MPSATLRFSGGKERPMTPNTMENPLQPSEAPISKPALSVSSRLVEETDIRHRPMA